MRVVIDTNVIVSSFLSYTGPPAKIVDLWKDQAFDLVVSEEILSEYERALGYEHVQRIHKMSTEEIQKVIENFRLFAEVIKPTTKVDVVLDDPDDNKFIECAVDGGVDYIVSGDPHLLNIEHYQNIQIFTPASFLALILYCESSKNRL